MSTAERLAGARAAKDAGNERFKAKDLVGAMEQYEEVRPFVV